MILHEIIERIDKSGPTEWVDYEAVYQAAGLPIPDYIDMNAAGFTQYFFASWLCTDTEVGNSILFYEDYPVALVKKSARKADEEFYWLSQYMHQLVTNVLVKLIQSREECVQFANPEIDLGDGYYVGWSSNILNSMSTCVWNGEEYEVVEKADNWMKKSKVSHNQVGIRKPGSDGAWFAVPIDEVKFPYRLKKEK